MVLNCFYAHGERVPSFQRRIYWMLDPEYEHIVLVHYRDIRMRTAGNQTTSGPILQFSPNPSTLFSSLTSVGTQNASYNNYIGDSTDTNQHSSSSGVFAEVSSDVVSKNSKVDSPGGSSSSSEFEVRHALKRLEEQLSIGDDTFNSVDLLYTQGENLDSLRILDCSKDGDSSCGEGKSIVECEVDAKVDDYMARCSPPLKKQRIDSIIRYEDQYQEKLLKESRMDYYSPFTSTAQIHHSTPLYTSVRDFEGTSNRLLHTVYIYCAETIQHSFASHLSLEFRRKGIAAFVNTNETMDVVEGASAFLVVFSKNYLSSTSCMDMLLSVLHCRRKNGQLVIPVFYGISPSDVVVMKHEAKEWSMALEELRDLPRHHSREECTECELVEEIVKEVYEKLFPSEQIGINSRLLEIEQLICKQPWGIRRIGIWGMPGIGKTTFAKAVFDRISGCYQASCFIKHFERVFHEKGFHRLLEEHFGEILKELPRVCRSITRPSLPGDISSKKRTLVVLDDVHSRLAAKSFLEGFHWFGPGSLIIITSRDKNVFRQCQINHVYEVQSLNQNESLQLLSQSAFQKAIKEQNLLKLSKEVIDYANGNPSALSFYGRELKGKKLSEMEATFLKFKLRTPYKIRDLFKSSYESLDKRQKNIFMDIACFFNGENVDYVMQLLEGCGFSPLFGIDVLFENCLLTISENRIKMHSIIQDFGREIINGETIQVERRRRLWEPWTIKFLLEDDKLEANGYPKETCKRVLGTEIIEGIFLDTSNLLFDVKPTAFGNMLNLRLLKIYNSSYTDHYGLRLPKGLKSLPYELRLLHWENYPLQSLPEDFDPCHLVELNMPHSQLRNLWKGPKNLEMLKIVRLCHSEELTKIDDICEAPNVALIDLQGCTKLQSFPAMSKLQHLRVVNLSGCIEIKTFPEVSPNIEELHLEGTEIGELPVSIVTSSLQAKLNGELSNLLTKFSGVSNALNLEKLTSMVQVTSSNQYLGKLVCLNMKDCSHLQSLPQMVDLESLEVLVLSRCSNLKSIEGFPRNLKELYLVDTAVKMLPPLPCSIKLLNAHGCLSLISIPFDFQRLPRYYTFSNCFALSEQVISEFVRNALNNVDRLTREYQQQKELKKSLAFSFTVPSPRSQNFTSDLQPGSSVMIQLGSSWRNTLGLTILVEVSFSEDYQEANGFGISYICRWKDLKFVSHRLEKDLHCWNPLEGVRKDHLFVFCDLNIDPSTFEGNDLSILADLVVVEFFIVNIENKLVHESCTVKNCGVYVITDANEDTSFNMTQPLSSSDNLHDEVEEVLRVIYDDLDDNHRNLFLYLACLFNDEKADLVVPLIASTGVESSSRLKVLANKSLIHISPFGIVVRHGLLQKMGMNIVHRDFADECNDKISGEDEVANIAEMDSGVWDNKANIIEKLPHSFKIHFAMCLELKNLVDRIVRILPDIEDVGPGCPSAVMTLCLLRKTLEKTKQLLQYCSESSRIYMAVTGDFILSRGCRAKKSLEQCLTDIRSMVPTVLAIKVSPIIQDLKSTVLTLDPAEEEAGKAIRKMMERGTFSSLSSDETRDFHAAALKLQLTTPESIAIEKISLGSLLAKLGMFDARKRQILKYLLYFLKNHERYINRRELFPNRG